MTEPVARRELGRGERVLPGIWRLRLPLPWPGVPHCNAYALAAGDGIVLVDCGMHEPGSLAHLERALDQVNLRLESVRLLVCTHAHSDHYGQAADVIDRAGCELWMHPSWEHMRLAAEDPDAALARRIEVARQSGAPEEPLKRYFAERKGQGFGITRLVAPDRELAPGDEVQTDLGPLQVYETPGHAPSHICLFQPDRGLLLSGDHLLGRVSPYFDFGYTDDPVGEFLNSLDVVDALDARLCLSGHGRPFRDIAGHIEGNRAAIHQALENVVATLGEGPMTAFEIVNSAGNPGAMGAWLLTMTLCYLRHLQRASLVVGDGEDPERWRLA